MARRSRGANQLVASSPRANAVADQPSGEEQPKTTFRPVFTPDGARKWIVAGAVISAVIALAAAGVLAWAVSDARLTARDAVLMGFVGTPGLFMLLFGTVLLAIETKLLVVAAAPTPDRADTLAGDTGAVQAARQLQDLTVTTGVISLDNTGLGDVPSPTPSPSAT